MNTKQVLFGITLGSLVMQSHAAIVGFTSFEEPSTGGKYTDADTSSHALSNVAGLADVVYASTGSELGFSAFFTSTGGSGLSDDDFIGVTSFTGAVGSFSDGSQGYQLSDTDGIVTVTTDSVALLDGLSSVSIDFFLDTTGYESTDRTRIWAEVDGGVEIDLLNTAGSDINDLGIEGSWLTVTADLTGYTSAQLHFEAEFNAASETIYFDNVVFDSVAAVPVPAAAWLFISALSGMVVVRRK